MRRIPSDMVLEGFFLFCDHLPIKKPGLPGFFIGSELNNIFSFRGE
jgi:hypothetical protein